MGIGKPGSARENNHWCPGGLREAQPCMGTHADPIPGSDRPLHGLLAFAIPTKTPATGARRDAGQRDTDFFFAKSHELQNQTKCYLLRKLRFPR